MRIGDAIIDAVQEHIKQANAPLQVNEERLQFIVQCCDFLEADFVVSEDDAFSVSVSNDSHAVALSIVTNGVDFSGDSPGLPYLVEEADLFRVISDDMLDRVILVFAFVGLIL